MKVEELSKEVVSQLIGLAITVVAFFLLPAAQYIGLKRRTKTEGVPELWYLPKYCFRSVIGHFYQKHDLTDIKVKVRLREIIPKSVGCTAATFFDTILVNDEELFIFPKQDQVMVCFQLHRAKNGLVCFVHTDKIGAEIKRYILDKDKNKDDPRYVLICDFTANVKNSFNFDIRISKRSELTSKSMANYLKQIECAPNDERQFPFDRIRNVGEPIKILQ